MIKKEYRLNESEVKKVLSKRKPFFSYGIVLNYFPNTFKSNRFAIVIPWKVVKNNISRNFFRRRFYSLVFSYINTENNKTYDMVFLLKKETKLDKNDFESIKLFDKDIKFLLKKIINS